MIKNKAIFSLLMLSSLIFVQSTFNSQEQSIAEINANVLVSQEEIEHASGFLGSFEQVISQSATLEVLLKKMADCIKNLKKAKEGCITNEEMQSSQDLRQAIDSLNGIYEQCAVEINKLTKTTNHSNEEILHMLLIKLLSQ